MAKRSTRRPFVRPQTARVAPVNLEAPATKVMAMAPPDYQPRDVQQPEPVDIGAFTRGPHDSPLTIQSRGSAMSAATQRMRAQDPNLTRSRVAKTKDRAVPVDELETHPPVPLIARGRLPIPEFPVDGNFARQANPLTRFEENLFTPLNGDGDETDEPDEMRAAPVSRGTPYDPVAVAKRLQSQQAPAQLPQPSRSELQLAPLTVEDVDLMWDWIRQEPDRGQAYLGARHKSGLDMHQHMQKLMSLERSGQALIRSIVVQNALVGQLVIHPINTRDRIANVHLFVGPPYRHALDALLPALMQEGESLVPKGMRIAVYGREGWDAILPSLGFDPHTVWIRER